MTEAVNEYLAPIRARRAEYAQDRAYIRQVLRDGNERANAVADATLKEVRAAMNASLLTRTPPAAGESAPRGPRRRPRRVWGHRGAPAPGAPATTRPGGSARTQGPARRERPDPGRLAGAPARAQALRATPPTMVW